MKTFLIIFKGFKKDLFILSVYEYFTCIYECVLLVCMMPMEVRSRHHIPCHLGAPYLAQVIFELKLFQFQLEFSLPRLLNARIATLNYCVHSCSL